MNNLDLLTEASAPDDSDVHVARIAAQFLPCRFNRVERSRSSTEDWGRVVQVHSLWHDRSVSPLHRAVLLEIPINGHTLNFRLA